MESSPRRGPQGRCVIQAIRLKGADDPAGETRWTQTLGQRLHGQSLPLASGRELVATKTTDQLHMQALHRVRKRLVSQRAGVIQQIRAKTVAGTVVPRTRRISTTVALEPIREVRFDEMFAASRLSMMRIMAMRTNAVTVVVAFEVTGQATIAADPGERSFDQRL